MKWERKSSAKLLRPGHNNSTNDSNILPGNPGRKQRKKKEANFIPTRKGSFLLEHEGYAFRLKNKLAYGKKQWYCTSRTKTGCQADITTVSYQLKTLVNRVRNKHNHPPPGFYRRNDGSFRIV